jgi:hypothetical protein
LGDTGHFFRLTGEQEKYQIPEKSVKLQISIKDMGGIGGDNKKSDLLFDMGSKEMLIYVKTMGVTSPSPYDKF